MKASYKVYKFQSEWTCEFRVADRPDFDAYGTDGTGCKLYASEEKAIAAGKRYLSKMKKLGFEI